MDPTEAKKMAETVEAGLRDGRSLESLRKAMKDSGYGDGDIHDVLARVDRKKTARRPAPKKRRMPKGLLTAAVLLALVIILSIGINLMMRPPAAPVPGPAGNVSPPSPYGESSNATRTCYVLNDTVKEQMIKAGAQCDKWYILKELSDGGRDFTRACYVLDEQAKEQMVRAGATCDVWYYLEDMPNISVPENASRTCYAINETIRGEMIQAGAKCDNWYLIQEI